MHPYRIKTPRGCIPMNTKAAARAMICFYNAPLVELQERHHLLFWRTIPYRCPGHDIPDDACRICLGSGRLPEGFDGACLACGGDGKDHPELTIQESTMLRDMTPDLSTEYFRSETEYQAYLATEEHRVNLNYTTYQASPASDTLSFVEWQRLRLQEFRLLARPITANQAVANHSDQYCLACGTHIEGHFCDFGCRENFRMRVLTHGTPRPDPDDPNYGSLVSGCWCPDGACTCDLGPIGNEY